MKLQYRRKCGFTLVEAIAALAVLGVVGTIGTVTFFRLTDLWNKTRTQSELDATAQAIFDYIGRDLRQIVPVHLSGKPLVGVTETYRDTGQFWGVTLNSDQVSFVSYVPMADGLANTVLVTYAVDRDKMTLMRRSVALTVQGGGANEQKIAEGVFDLTMEFSDGSDGWVRGWNKNTLPKAVRISVSLAHPTRIHEQIARKAVLPIPVE